MAEGVTYADLRFIKSPPREKGPPPGRDPPHEEASEGEEELTYQNCPAAARSRQPDGSPGPHPSPLPGPLKRRIRGGLPLAVLGAGLLLLLLLAACLGLGLRYGQVSGELAGASQRHGAESSAQAERLRNQTEELSAALQRLSRAQAELDATRRALEESWQEGNSTQRQLQGERERWKEAERGLQWEKNNAIQQLEAAKRVLDRAKSCQEIDCCPPEWKRLSQKCLWFSSERKTWGKSQEDCRSRAAQLLVLQPWGAVSIWHTAAIMSHLQKMEFWVGLSSTRNNNWQWLWVDGQLYNGVNLGHYGDYGDYGDYCVKMSHGTLQTTHCNSESQRYVCEKAATPFSWSTDPNA